MILSRMQKVKEEKNITGKKVKILNQSYTVCLHS